MKRFQDFVWFKYFGVACLAVSLALLISALLCAYNVCYMCM